MSKPFWIKKTLGEIFDESPEAALEERFRRELERAPYGLGTIFIWTSVKSKDGTRYGSYKYVTRKDLEGREFDIEFLDYDVSLLYTDVIFEPRGCKYIPKEKNNE